MATFRSVTPILAARSLDETIAFYTNVLGFSLRTTFPEAKPSFCLLTRDRVVFAFSSELWPGDPHLSGQISIEVDDAMDVFRSVGNRATIEWGPEVFHYHRREFSMKDCNGYSIVISEPTNDPTTCLED